MQVKVVDSQVSGEDTLLDLHQFSSFYVLMCGRRGDEGRGRIREKKGGSV